MKSVTFGLVLASERRGAALFESSSFRARIVVSFISLGLLTSLLLLLSLRVFLSLQLLLSFALFLSALLGGATFCLIHVLLLIVGLITAAALLLSYHHRWFLAFSFEYLAR